MLRSIPRSGYALRKIITVIIINTEEGSSDTLVSILLKLNLRRDPKKGKE